eukprot:7388476-Prymnesium_polylepis.1
MGRAARWAQTAPQPALPRAASAPLLFALLPLSNRERRVLRRCLTRWRRERCVAHGTGVDDIPKVIVDRPAGERRGRAGLLRVARNRLLAVVYRDTDLLEGVGARVVCDIGAGRVSEVNLAL